MNSRLLNRYYAILQISIAEQIASSDPEANLESIQKHTEFGHGLFTHNLASSDFPNDYLIGCLKNGHFAAYLKFRSFDCSQYLFERKPRGSKSISEDDRKNLLSLSDLIRRIPEMQKLSRECLNSYPLSFHIGYATENHRRRQFSKNEGDSPEQTVTFVSIFHDDKDLDEAALNTFGLPIQNIKRCIERGESFFQGEVSHPSSQIWWDSVPTYKSGYCGSSVIVPAFGCIQDAFTLHLMILYACSIIVRYLPSLWHKIEDGDLNHIYALLEYYVSIVDNALPAIAIERITGKRIIASAPGSMNAPV